MSSTNGHWEYDENGKVHFVEDSAPVTDGSYHYSYRSAGSAEPVKKSAPASGHDTGWHWIFIVLGFMAWAPIGVLLLVLHLTGHWPGSRQVSREIRRATNAAKSAANEVKQQMNNAAGNYGQTTQQVQERLKREKAAQAETARRQAEEARAKAEQEKSRKKKDRDEGAAHGLGHVRLFRVIGGILTGVFGFAFVEQLIEELTHFSGIGWLLNETIPLLALMLAGVTLLLMAGSRRRKLKKFQKYLKMVGDRTNVSTAALASAMGLSEKKTVKDLEEMLDRNFWEEGYVDAARHALVLGSPLEEETPEPEPEPAPADDTAAATLRHIRQVNDAIADEEMSNKIYRIEELSAKIFQMLDERPEKASELRSFMNYYLPQTLKILESYSKLEAQGIEGENIAEAKGKIEGMMDKLVDGYETQLDKLFEDDVMDISADLKVMETMLEKDGLTADSELKF